ncbi:MAG: DUF421 domain-containing protein [Clostridiales bacterium]|jgi:uncharacterized membrane protein YcaP (DUF421 family)|nr:DUF421 domain-containing protein [Clostridiales bacterium]
MLLIFIRTTIIFAILFLIIRLMGKRQIGEMQPFEFVITLLIAELACIPMADLSTPIGFGIIAILTLFVLHQVLTIGEKSCVFIGRLISSKPSIIIDSNGINYKELKHLNISLNELQENLRIAGYCNFDEIEYALLETNGKFSFLKKQPSEGEKKPPKTPLPVCIVEEGKYKEWELNKLGLDKDYFEKLFKENGAKSLKEVEVATIDSNGKVYFQKKNSKYKVIETGYTGRRPW